MENEKIPAESECRGHELFNGGTIEGNYSLPDSGNEVLLSLRKDAHVAFACNSRWFS